LDKYNIRKYTDEEWWDSFNNMKRYRIIKNIFEHGIYSNGIKYRRFLKLRNKYNSYRRSVEKRSIRNAIRYNIHGIKNRNHQLVKGSKCIDHIVSIKFGFVNNIPVNKIADCSNLRIISHQKNSKKSSKLTEEAINLLNKWDTVGFFKFNVKNLEVNKIY
jgi:hypothetical protein